MKRHTEYGGALGRVVRLLAVIVPVPVAIALFTVPEPVRCAPAPTVRAPLPPSVALPPSSLMVPLVTDCAALIL